MPDTVSVFASDQEQRRSVLPKAGGVQLRLLGPWTDVSQDDVHSVRRGEHADRFCSGSLTTPYRCSVNKAIHIQLTAIYYLFTELVCLEVVLTQITDPWIEGFTYKPTGQLCLGIS